jgi:hypothetical protein
MSAASKRHMGRVAELGCIICDQPAQVHHIRKPGLVGAGQRASDWLVLPLCMEHHTGDAGIHGLGRRCFEDIYGDQLHLWELVMDRAYK